MYKLFSATIVAIAVLFAGLFSVQQAAALGFVFRSGIEVPSGGTYQMVFPVSTSTGLFMKNGTATTTLTFPSETFSSVTVFVRASFPTTNINSYLSIEAQASDDGIDFFNYDNTRQNQSINPTVASTSVTLASTTMPFLYRPTLKGSTTTKAFNIELIPARYTRLIYTLVSTSTVVALPDSATIWSNVAGQVRTDR